MREALARGVQQQPRRLDRVAADGDRGCTLEALAPGLDLDVGDAGDAAARLVELDPDGHRVGADLDAVLDRVGDVGDERAGLGVHLAALQAEAAVDAVRPVAEDAVCDRDRPDAHLDPVRARARPGALGGTPDRVRRVRVAVRIAPRPVLAGDRQLALDPLVVRLQVPVGDRPVGADAVARARLEVGGMEARRVAGVVDHRAADPVPGVVLAQLDRVVAADDALVRPVEVVRAFLVGDPVLVGVPEGAALEHDDPPARAREPLGEHRAAGAAADDQQVDLVLVAEAAHPLAPGDAAAVRRRAGRPNRCPSGRPSP